MKKGITFNQRRISDSAFKKRTDDIIRMLEDEVGGWSAKESTPAARKARIERCRDDFFEFGRTYLPHYFKQAPAAFHYELVEMISRRGGGVTPVAVAAPRGFAKSTLVSFGYVIYQICFKLRKFIILASDTKDLAADNTGYIQLELAENEKIKADFNDGNEFVSLNAAIDDYVTDNNIRVLARGRGQRVRGLKHGPHRPDLWIGDDLEDEAEARNPKRVDKLLKWLKATVYPAIDEEEGSMFIIGTIITKKSALNTIIKGKDEPYNNWTRKLYKAIYKNQRGDDVSLWPERHPLKALLRQKITMGSLDFNQEKMNDPIDEESAFREKWVKKYAFKLSDITPGTLPTAGFFDPSISENQSADFKAIAVVVLNPAGELLVPKIYLRKDSLEQAERQAFAIHKIWHFMIFGVESNVFQKLLIKDFIRLGKRLGQLPVRGVNQTLNKVARITGMSPLVENGILRFLREEDQDEDYRELMEQLYTFQGSYDDGPDALEGAVSLLNYGAQPGFIAG